MRVAVLGCGPAGLFAAHAAMQSGHQVAIYSVKRKSEMFGAQYLHKSIPMLTPYAPEFAVRYWLDGSDIGYAEKVYGELPPDFVSPSKLAGKHMGWDIRRAYDRAWDMYERRIVDTGKLDPALLVGLYRDKLQYADQVISTIPANVICYETGIHTFQARVAWAIGDAPERGVECPVSVPENTVECDGTPDRSWYRAANIRGFKTCEWPEDVKPPYDDVAQVTKVIRTNCNCYQKMGWWRTGRYGAWDKKLLTHHAYWDILKAFQPDSKATRG